MSSIDPKVKYIKANTTTTDSLQGTTFSIEKLQEAKRMLDKTATDIDYSKTYNLSAHGVSTIYSGRPLGKLVFSGTLMGAKVSEGWTTNSANKQGWEKYYPEMFKKNDEDKPQWNLLPWEIIEDVVCVLTKGEKKYPGENWKKCTDKNRYMNAVDRHLMAFREGIKEDTESGESHLVHAICNLLFLASLEDKGEI